MDLALFCHETGTEVSPRAMWKQWLDTGMPRGLENRVCWDHHSEVAERVRLRSDRRNLLNARSDSVCDGWTSIGRSNKHSYERGPSAGVVDPRGRRVSAGGQLAPRHAARRQETPPREALNYHGMGISALTFCGP